MELLPDTGRSAFVANRSPPNSRQPDRTYPCTGASSRCRYVQQLYCQPICLTEPVAQQVSLSTGAADYILHAPRTTILSANKEGLLSLPGYLSLHILGLATGTTTLPPSPSFFRRQQHSLDKRETRKKRDDSDDEQTDDEDEAGSSAGATQAQVHRENDKTATELFSWACVYWVLLGACAFFNIDAGVSRRMVCPVDC